MGYIRLETLVKELEENPFTMSICMTADECKGMNRARLLIAKVVKAMPVEDVRPVVHGKWIKNGWSIRCSECGYDMPYTIRNFCPNCGAKMDLED